MTLFWVAGMLSHACTMMVFMVAFMFVIVGGVELGSNISHDMIPAYSRVSEIEEGIMGTRDRSLTS